MKINRFKLAKFHYVLVVLLVTVAAAALWQNHASAQTNRLSAQGDTLVDPNNPSVNYNGQRLETTYSNFPTFVATRFSLLQFNLSGTSSVSDQSQLTLEIVENNIPGGGTVAVALYTTEDSWAENTVTFDTRPAAGTLLQTIDVSAGTTGPLTFGNGAVGAYIEQSRTGDGLASFIVRLDGGSGNLGFGSNILFEDREGSDDGINGNEPFINLLPEPATVTPTFTPTDTPVPTDTPTNTPVPTDTPTNTPVPTDTPTNTPAPTDTPTNTPVPTDTPTNTPVPTDTPTNTPVPTDTPTNTPVPTDTPTNTPVPPTDTPTPTPTDTPTLIPPTPTPTPTDTPTLIPPTPTPTPTDTPTLIPPTPTPTPTDTPTLIPPTPTPTDTPTLIPPTPTPTPTDTPTLIPPTPTPTDTPTLIPPTPTPTPTDTPTLIPPTPTPTVTNTPLPPTPTPTSTVTNTPIPPTPTPTNTPVPPTPTHTPTPPPNGTCGPLTQEAEDAQLSGSFSIGTDSSASNGQYITAGGYSNSIDNNNDQAVLCFNVTTPGTYRLRGWVLAPKSSSNSFFVQIDDQPANGYLWQMPLSTSYQPVYLTNRGSGPDPVEVFLDAGEHQVVFFEREKNTRLDKVQLELVGDEVPPTPTNTPVPPTPTNTPVPPTPTHTPVPPTPTNTPVPPTPTHTPVPPTPTNTPVPPTPTNTPVPPTPTHTPTPPPNGTCGPLTQEAEDAQLSGSFSIGTDSGASNGQYITAGGYSNSIDNNNDQAVLCFKVTTPGTYRLRGWVLAPKSSSNSFFVQIDDQPANGYLWQMPLSTSYQPVYLTNRGSGPDPVEVFLDAGEHQVVFFEREKNTFLDKVQLVLVGDE